MRIVKIKKGLNIPLKGAAETSDISDAMPDIVAIKPDDFIGFTPKMLVKPGETVHMGTPVCYNKTNETIRICSPVSGEIMDVIRGEKRKILEILIKNDLKYTQLNVVKPGNNLSREEILNMLLQSGLFSLIRQRPYDTIPNHSVIPRDIYISCFDSSPLAPDYNFILAEKTDLFQAGVDVLSKITDGSVHLGINAEQEKSVFEEIKNAEKHYFKGPHPAGNIGVQIHHTNPINKGETIWYVNPQDVAAIGKYFTEGNFDATRIITLCGPNVEKPKYLRTITGAKISSLLANNTINQNSRIISGNVLTGTQIESNGFLGYYHQQITVIPEGNYHEFIGWALPGFKKYSNTWLFPSKLFPKSNFKIDTNYHGGLRAFVMSGQYEKVFPFDIYPVYLLKAILTEDIDKMEELGIYEVSAEDFALCDFVCTSKIEAQQIIKQGFELLRKEMS